MENEEDGYRDAHRDRLSVVGLQLRVPGAWRRTDPVANPPSRFHKAGVPLRKSSAQSPTHLPPSILIFDFQFLIPTSPIPPY